MRFMEDKLLLKILSFLVFSIFCQSFVACQTQEQKIEAEDNRCIELHKQEKTEEAIACFESFVKANPEWGNTYYFLSANYEKLGQVDKAIEMIKIYLSMYPLSDYGHRDYCDLLMDKGDVDKAFEECSRAVSLNSKSALNYTTLAEVCEKRDNFLSAENFYRIAVKIEPNNDTALGSLGRFYENRGRYDEAIDNYQRLLQLKPSYAEKVEQRMRDVEKKRDDQKQNKSETSKSKN